MSPANEWKPPIGPSVSPLLQRIDQLLAERNATGVAIDNAMRGILPDKHSMLIWLKMIAGLSSARNALEARVNTIDECNDELVAENERLRELVRLARDCQSVQLSHLKSLLSSVSGDCYMGEEWEIEKIKSTINYTIDHKW